MLKAICSFNRQLKTNYRSCCVPAARLSRQFDPNLLQRHIPWLAVWKCSKAILHIIQCCQAFLHNPSNQKDWLANLNCFSIKKHKTVLVLYHLTKLHAVQSVYSRVREAQHRCLQMDFHYRFLFSTSATSSSVENCPLTTMIKFLMTSSEQSTSRSPPTTAGIRLGFT